jgi:hypothetical protein
VVWNHITALLADPRLIRAEIDTRLASARTADPVARQRKRLESARWPRPARSAHREGRPRREHRDGSHVHREPFDS